MFFGDFLDEHHDVLGLLVCCHPHEEGPDRKESRAAAPVDGSLLSICSAGGRCNVGILDLKAKISDHLVEVREGSNKFGSFIVAEGKPDIQIEKQDSRH